MVIYTPRYYLRRFLETMSVTKKAVPFAKATEVKIIDSHTYEVNLEDDWCIGTGKLDFLARFMVCLLKIADD